MPKDPKIIQPINASLDDVAGSFFKTPEALFKKPIPHAKWTGTVELVGERVDCYVLDTGQRIIALQGAVKAISEGAELTDFSIAGTKARGITTYRFEAILKSSVQALYDKTDLTDKQRDNALKCALISSGLIHTGLNALVDEATGRNPSTTGP